ncbi:hypothetical protein GMSM_25800 [Geomonas sp. Red276]
MLDNPLQNSRLFDPYRYSNHKNVIVACECLYRELGFNDKRLRPYVMMLLLDLYWCWRSDPTQYICCARDKNRYGANSRYASIAIGHRGIVKVMNGLIDNEYVEHVDATCYRDPVTNKPYAGYTNRIRAKKKLVRLMVKHKVKLSMISRHPNETVIKFRSEKDENDVARDIKEFTAPRDVERSAKILTKYNNLLQRSYIDLDDELATDEELREAGIREYKIDLSRKGVYRVFNDENWRHGGRIYGAWWHGCPKELRKYILIDNEPVVELDFSSIHVLLLYAHLGANFLDEGADAYTIEGHDFRSAMKVVMMSAINAKPDDEADGETRAIQATWDTLIKKLNRKRVEYGITSHESLYEMLDAIKERHKPIADFLESGEGIRLQREDSDIAVDIIEHHLKMNVPILTVHDSFIVPRMMWPFTIDIMNQAYGKMVAKYLGAGFKSTADTIHWHHGLIQQDTSDNINVSGLIKPAYTREQLTEAYNRLDTRVTSKQLRRQFRWCKNKYQYDILYRKVLYRKKEVTGVEIQEDVAEGH